jgi:SAM-dependent methyltransferase
MFYNKQNQRSPATSYNRYPEIFNELILFCNNPNKILSFGCSSGEECNTLSELYFPNTKIIGLDINSELILNNKKTNKNYNISYYDDISKMKKDDITKFDLITVMSVLCHYPPHIKYPYTFKLFNDTIELIDSLLNINGYICMYNSEYLFTDTEIFKKKYKIIDNTIWKDTGFIQKYTPNKSNKINNYPYFLFQKIVD